LRMRGGLWVGIERR